jgi:hypothetical protein
VELTTIPAAVARAAQEFGDAPALAEPGGPRFSYRELHERAATVARALIAEAWPRNHWHLVPTPITGYWARSARSAGATLVPVHQVHRPPGARRDRPRRHPR